MSNVTRYDPFSLEPVSDLFQGLFRPLRGIADADDEKLASMKIDVTENDQAYAVKAELPGVDKNDINVQIDGNTVSIS
ncbi:Hsp20 family protein, partial [Burkholderia pseudomallei]